jgi:hypothetical protein
LYIFTVKELSRYRTAIPEHYSRIHTLRVVLSVVVIGAYTYLVGGSHYHTARSDLPIVQPGLDLKGGI